MITFIAGIVCIAAIYKLRKMVCGPSLKDRLFIDKNDRYGRAHMIRGAKIEYSDPATEREISEWLYPKER